MIQNKLFVGCLPYDLTLDAFKLMFTRFGKTVDEIIVTDRRTHISKGFGYVTFLKHKDAIAAIAAMDQELIEGKKRLVTFAKPGT